MKYLFLNELIIQKNRVTVLRKQKGNIEPGQWRNTISNRKYSLHILKNMYEIWRKYSVKLAKKGRMHSEKLAKFHPFKFEASEA